MSVCQTFLLESCLRLSVIVFLIRFAFVVCHDSNNRKLESTEHYSDDLGSTDALRDQIHILTSPDSITSETNVKVDIRSDSCSMYGTCEFISDMQMPMCRCDEICHLYKDCCIDISAVSLNDIDDPHFKCIKTVIQPSDQHKYFGVFVINNCPKHLRDTIIDMKCRTYDLLEVGPWVASDNNFVFQNRFCAACYNVDSYKPFALNISRVPDKFFFEQINSTTNGRLIAALTDPWKQKIRAELIPPENINIRSCFVVDEAPDVEDEVCLNYNMNPVIDFGPHNFPHRNPFYRNQFCLPANHSFECLGKYKDLIRPSEELHSLFPLSVMFPFKQRDHRCENEVNGLCIDKELFENYETNKTISLISSTSLTWNVIQQLALVMAWSMHADIKTVGIKYNKINGVDGQGNNNHSLYGIHQFDMTGQIKKILTVKDMLDFETKYKSAVWSIKLNYSNGLSEVNTVVGNGPQPSLNPRRLLSTILIGTRTETMKIDIKGKLNARLCDKIILECDINDENRDQELTVKEMTCIDYAKKSQRTPTAKDVSMKVITYSGMGISVIALTVSVIIHRRLKMHVSIPGSNVENLSVALLFSDIAFLIGVGANDNYVLCYVVGILLHYLWLIVFSFKSIALIHMCYSITQMSTNHSYAHGETQNKRRIFTFLGLFLPIMIVAPAFVIDLVEVPGFNLDYSGTICFPTGYPANLIFVSIPIGLSVIINITCLICIAGFIAKQSFDMQNVRKSTSFQHVQVFARISVVTGMLWTTGLIGAIIQTEFMEYVFVVCCSIQSLLIGIANLTTKRVYRALWNNEKSST